MNAPHHPLARAPERSFDVDGDGIRLRAYEWGDPQAPPLLLTHGMADHGRGFDMLAPQLASHFRVVAYDARGHGDSAHADSYGWPADLRDIATMIDHLGGSAVVVGHSKGGAQATDLAAISPKRVRKLVDIDGFGPPEGGFERTLGETEPRLPPPDDCRAFLDARRRASTAGAGWKPYASFDALVERRAKQNPRLPEAWLRYFLFHGAVQGDDGWRWKVDPLVFQGTGPWQPTWINALWRRLRVPLLAVTGDTPDAWGPCDEPTLQSRLEGATQVERAIVRDAGHFVHMEQPRETARIVLDFLLS